MIKINWNDILTIIISGCILATLGVIGTQVYNGAVKDKKVRLYTDEVIMTKIAELSEKIDKNHAIRHTEKVDIHSDNEPSTIQKIVSTLNPFTSNKTKSTHTNQVDVIKTSDEVYNDMTQQIEHKMTVQKH